MGDEPLVDTLLFQPLRVHAATVVGNCNFNMVFITAYRQGYRAAKGLSAITRSSAVSRP